MISLEGDIEGSESVIDSGPCLLGIDFDLYFHPAGNSRCHVFWPFPVIYQRRGIFRKRKTQRPFSTVRISGSVRSREVPNVKKIT